MEKKDNQLKLHGLSVVNGCQSLNTILSCSEKVKTLEDTYVLFRFYEIPQRDRADRISINTNSQSAVKPRDLRSNDKRVLNIKKQFEQKYPQGYFITKRGEVPPADKDKSYVLDFSDLGKFLIALAFTKDQIFHTVKQKYLTNTLSSFFKREYKPENAQALNFFYQEILKTWGKENPLGLNETLLAMKAYAPYHHLYAVSMCFSISNNQAERVPFPIKCYEKAKEAGMIGEIIKIDWCESKYGT
jgi:AIPR protein.